MSKTKTFKFLIVFFAILILLSVVGSVFSLVGAIIGTVFSIFGLILKLIFSKSFLTLLFVGWIAYLIVSRSGEKNRYPQCVERDF